MYLFFCDKESNSYAKHVEKKFGSNNPQELIKHLNSYKNRADVVFKQITVHIIGAISVHRFISSSIFFKENETFRINLNKDLKTSYWKAKASMYRIFIKYLKDIDKLIIPLNINLCKHKPKDTLKFKKWFENTYKSNEFVKVSLDEKTYIKLPL